MIKEFKDAVNHEPPVSQHGCNNFKLQDPIIKTLMEQNQRLMEILAQKKNVNLNKKRDQGTGSYCTKPGSK